MGRAAVGIGEVLQHHTELQHSQQTPGLIHADRGPPRQPAAHHVPVHVGEV